MFSLLVVSVVIFSIVKACSPSSSDSGPSQSTALTTCRQGVKQLLKNPSTASFSGESFRGSGSTITVSGSVAADNAVGGKVTYTYSCDFNDGVAHVRPLTAR